MNLILPNRLEYDALTRLSLPLFLTRVFAELNPGVRYYDNWHIDLIAQHLEAARAGKIKRLAVNIPPRNLKSIIVSVAYVAWLLGQDPRTKIICASYNEDLAVRLGRWCLQVMQAKWYRALFPRTRLAADRPSAADFETTMGGGRIATSVGGTLAGLGGGFIIIDDPIKPEEAWSDTRRQSTNDWYSQSVVPRLNDKPVGVIILIMQRLHEEDLTGYAVAQGGWTHLSLPAIAQEDESFAIETPFGTYHQRRLTGEALHPDREPLEVLADLRRSMTTAFFSAQYLQSPTPPGGGMVKLDWFPRFDLAHPPRIDRVIQSWDTGLKVKDLSSYSVCTTWGIAENKPHLLHVLRGRLEYPDLRRAVLEQAAFYRPSDVLIEEAASGISLLQDLRADLPSIRGIKPAGEKAMRMRAQTARIENGLVLLPLAAPWLADFEHELVMFPKGRYEDQIDSVSQALNFIFGTSDCEGWVQYYAELAAGGRGLSPAPDPEAYPVRAIATGAPCDIKTNSGRLVKPDANGIYWLSQQEAQAVCFMPGMKVLHDGN